MYFISRLSIRQCLGLHTETKEDTGKTGVIQGGYMNNAVISE